MALQPLFLIGITELVVVLLVLAVYVGLPTLLIIVVYNYLDGKRGYEKRISALERRVEKLEDEQSSE